MTPDIITTAANLGNDPVRIFDFVLNQFEFEPYYVGLVKGPTETLYERAGNDYDLATVLVALLRAAGVTARYAIRTIKIDAATATSWIGVTDPLAAANILATGGLNVTLITSKGAISALVFDHVWAEAYVSSGGGKAWKALDPSFKLHTLTPGQNILGATGLGGQTLLDSLKAITSIDETNGAVISTDFEDVFSVLDTRQDQFVSYLTQNAPTLTVNQVIGKKAIVSQPVSSLPTRPPLSGKGSTTRFTDVQDFDKQFIRFRVYGLDATLPLPSIAHQKISLTFAAATPADQAAIETAGGLLYVAPEAVNLKPQLRVGGAVVAEGAGGPLGDYAYFAVDFSERGQVLGQALHIVTIGGIYSVALDFATVPLEKMTRSRDRLNAAIAADGELLSDDYLGELLHAMGLTYFRFNNQTSEFVAGTQNAVYFHQVSEALLSYDLMSDFSDGTAHMSLAGYTIDVKRNIVAAFDKAGSPDFRQFPVLMTNLLTGSSWEHMFFHAMGGWPAVSTMQFFHEAAQNEVRIFGIGPENINTILPTLSIPPDLQSEVQQAVANGLRVLLPERLMKIADWTGLGFVEYNPKSGTGGFLLAEQLNGGISILRKRRIPIPQQIKQEKKQANVFVAFFDGLILGSFSKTHYDDPWATGAKALGHIVSGLFVVGNVRDAVADTIKVVESGGKEGKLDLALDLIGLIPELGEIGKGSKVAIEAGEVALKETAVAEKAIAQLEKVAAEDAAKVAVNLDKASTKAVEEVTESTLKGVLSEGTKVVQNGIEVETRVVADGEKLLQSLEIAANDGSKANRGLAAERASDALAQERNWQVVGDYSNKGSNVTGVDRVYVDPATGRYKVVESKFMEGEANFAQSKLNTTVEGKTQTQLSDQWLLQPGGNNALDRSVANGTLTQAQADAIKAANDAGKLDKEIVILKNNQDGRTISQAIGSNPQIGTASGNPVKVTIIEMPKTLPKP